MTETSPEIVHLPDLHLAISELMLLFGESANFQRNAAAKAVLEEAVSCLAGHYRRIQRRSEQDNGRYVVTLVGLTNVGKSTLLNALLGRDLAPRKNGPCTAVPVEFVASNRLHVVAHYEGTARREYSLWTTDAEVHRCLADLAVDGGGGTSSRMTLIEVGVPNLPFNSNLVIADTPGFGAAQIGQASGTHDQAVTEYLTHTASQVMWVVAGGQGVTEREKVFHDRHIANVCEDLIVTGCEDWTNDEKEKSSRLYKEGLGRQLLKSHYVSGKLGIQARQQGDEAMFTASGIKQLQGRLEELADGTRQKSTINQSLKILIQDLRDWRIRYRCERRHQNGKPFWRPDSWNRWTQFLTECAEGRLRQSYLGDLDG